MRIAIKHSEPVNLDAIQSFLLSHRAPETAMGLTDLDGFLTAIAIGPETIMPSEWLPVVWGGEDSIFDDLDEAWSVSSLIVDRYRDIASSLQSDPEGWAPVFWESDGEVIVADWAAGFLDAIDLRPEPWAPLFGDRAAAVLMLPILLAAGEPGVAEKMGIGPAEESVWLRQAVKHIPMAVPAIDAYWKERRKPELSPSSSERRFGKGRLKEVCPCGSGRKFRRCCGAH
jgi:uncharacterized protein